MHPKLLEHVLIFYLKFFSVYALVESYVPQRRKDLIFLGSKPFLTYLMQK